MFLHNKHYPKRQSGRGVEASFIHPAGQSRSFTFSKPENELLVAQNHIIMTVNPSTATGRVYQLSSDEAAAATTKFAKTDI